MAGLFVWFYMLRMDNRRFVGNGWGVAFLEAQQLSVMYTPTIGKGYIDTANFYIYVTPVYSSIVFFDGNFNPLGHYQCGAIGMTGGTGGGLGSWS